MNWSKAKTIFIVILCITDLFLFGFYRRNQEKYVAYEESPAFEKQTVELLERNDITTSVSIPNAPMSLPVLDLEYASFSAGSVNQRFFGGDGIVSTDDNGVERVEYLTEAVGLGQNHILYYTREDRGKKNTKDAKEIAEVFLRNRSYSLEDNELISVEETEDGSLLTYKMRYNGVYVEPAYMKVIVMGDKVVAFERMWLKVIREEENLITLPGAAKPLLNLLSNEEARGKEIVEIAPTYYFEEEVPLLDGVSIPVSGRSSVAWRVRFSDGTIINLPL